MTRPRTVLLLVTCAMLAAASFAASARARRGWRRHADRAGWLNLSQQQHEAVHEADPDFDAEAQVLSQRLGERRQALATMLESQTVEDEAVLAQVERVIEAHNALERRVARVDVYKLWESDALPYLRIGFHARSSGAPFYVFGWLPAKFYCTAGDGDGS